MNTSEKFEWTSLLGSVIVVLIFSIVAIAASGGLPWLLSISLDQKSIRDWLQLVLVGAGSCIAYFTYTKNLHQRRVENSLKFIELFREGLAKNDMSDWQDLFVSSCEQNGAKAGFFVDDQNRMRPISDYFSEGAPTDAIARMAQALDVVCHQVNTDVADAQTVYYELGQLLTTMHDWLNGGPNSSSHRTLLDEFPSLKSFFIRYSPRTMGWPCRVYMFIE